MYDKSERKGNLKKENAREILGDYLYFDLIEIKDSTLLDKSLFGHFERCFNINKAISKYCYFLRFFERRNLYRYLNEKKKYQEKTRSQESCLPALLENSMVTRY